MSPSSSRPATSSMETDGMKLVAVYRLLRPRRIFPSSASNLRVAPSARRSVGESLYFFAISLRLKALPLFLISSTRAFSVGSGPLLFFSATILAGQGLGAGLADFFAVFFFAAFFFPFFPLAARVASSSKACSSVIDSSVSDLGIEAFMLLKKDRDLDWIE